MNTYIVMARLKFPSSYHIGYDYEIHAKTKTEAIKAARKRVANDGHTRQDGALTFTAEKIN